MRHLQIRLLTCFALIAASTGSALAGEKNIPANSMGLSKTNVFDTPAPQIYRYGETPPGKSKISPRAYLGAPPQIPHDINYFLPITAQKNMCINCHSKPEKWGMKHEEGMPTPMPPSHYTDLRNEPGKATDHVIGARYNCNLCHVPQADTTPLVENTFSSRRAR